MTELYHPLDASIPEIRLFVLEPAPTDESPLAGHLRTVPLNSGSPYEALSYKWGAPNHTQPVSIEGRELLVTPNLDVALRGLRRREEPRVLWIDAICINQQSLQERGQQVALMRHIYAQCTRGLVWLGPLAEVEAPWPTPKTAEMAQGFQLLQKLVDRDMTVLEPMVQAWDTHERTMKSAGWEYTRKENHGRLTEAEADEGKDIDEGSSIDVQLGDIDEGNRAFMLSGEDQQALESAFQRPDVLRRLWVMQELSLAPSVQLLVGRHALDWDVLSSFLGNTPYADAFHGTFSHGVTCEMLPRIFKALQTIEHQRRLSRWMGRGEEKESKLLDVLARFRRTECLDPRDKIFGLLGLVTDHRDIAIDYRRTVAQVYMDVTVSLINQSGNLDIICQSPWGTSVQFGHRTQSIVDGLPSWAVNFQVYSEVRLFAQRSIFSAGRASCETPCQREGEGALRARGVIVGHVGQILQDDYPADGSKFFFEDRISSSRKIPLEWLKLYHLAGDESSETGLDDQYITGEPRFTAFWRTLVADCAAYPMVRLDPERIQNEDGFVRQHWFQTSPAESTTEKEGERQQWQDFSDSKIYRMWGSLNLKWTFCLTTNGLYAMILPPAREGDVIACLDGAKLPIVLRPVEHETLSEAYQVINVAYVHGIMDMEAIQSPELRQKLGLKDQEFWLV